MRVRVLFFGVLKDVVGRAEDQLELEPGTRLDSVFARYAAEFPRLGGMKRSIAFARNRQFASGEAALGDGDEVAFLPPVSGGASRYAHEIQEPGGHFFALTHEPIGTRELATRLLRGEDGALVIFEGVARNNSNGRQTLCLDYECYEPMAVQVMAQIGCEIARAHAVGRIAMVHRLGRIGIGETSVAVLVAAPHRKAAFEAALEGIDRLKRTVPIWKKERFADGEVWVEGQWDDSVIGR